MPEPWDPVQMVIRDQEGPLHAEGPGIGRGEPVDEPLSSLALRALSELQAHAGPSRSRDRAAIRDSMSIPSHVFGWLAKKGAIASPDHPQYSDQRVVTSKGMAWLSDPSLIEDETNGSSTSHRRVHEALARFAQSEGLSVDLAHGHRLESRDAWRENL